MKRLLIALLTGAVAVFGFAPFEFFPLPLLSLAALFWLWRDAGSARRAALLGFTWGLGCFLGGVSWVYVSLHDVGGMAWPLAAVATLAFCAVLAVFPALAGALATRATTTEFPRMLLFTGGWALTEWLRGWVLTGFSWLALGYSQTPPSPLAGYAPVVGVYGIGFLLALLAALLSFYWRRWQAWLAMALILAAGQGLRGIEWTRPTGEAISVSLLQGNIPQSLKWVPEHLRLSFEAYGRLAAEHPAQLIVLPETAIPLMFDQIPRDFLRELTAHGDILIGSALGVRDGYTNSALALTAEQGVEAYSKTHLVPFGEYVPPGFAWFLRLVNIPMSDFRAGPPGQQPLAIAGQRVMPNICYEDLFGEELLSALPEATLLINLSNTAWFGDSLAQPQHLQIARLRALETGRPVLRAANTGMTAAIEPNGQVIRALTPFTVSAMTVSVRGYTGLTPYAHVGNYLVVILALLACLPALLARQRGRALSR